MTWYHHNITTTVPSHITYAVRMARWEPNARERLVRAALDLFTEQGYDATTVNEIADRAGLTKTTFFRHFPDKREVLFAGQTCTPGSSPTRTWLWPKAAWRNGCGT